MSGTWKESPRVLVAAGVIVVVLAVVIVRQLLPRQNPIERVFAGNLQFAVGFVAAGEIAQLMGGTPSRVALILPGAEARFKGSSAEAYERGFREAAGRLPDVECLGHVLVELPGMAAKDPDENRLSLKLFNAARAQHAQSNVLLCILGLPEFTDAELAQWVGSSPPKLVVADAPVMSAEKLQALFARGVVQRVLTMKSGQKLPATEPRGEPRKIFEQYYEVLKP